MSMSINSKRTCLNSNIQISWIRLACVLGLKYSESLLLRNLLTMDEDSFAEKTDDKSVLTNSSEYKANVFSNLSESLKQQITDGCVPTYTSVCKNERQYFPVASLQMKLNSRYISKISSSPRKLQDQSIRMRPYFIPERSRTKSESADTKNDIHSREAHVAVTEDLLTAQCDTMMDTSCDNICSTNTCGVTTVPVAVKLMKSGSLKKSKSLEDIRAKVVDGSQPSHEMEFVSSRIQKLKVQD